MKNTLSNFLIFAAGAAIGSAVTWKFLKTKYERIAQEEIESVKKEFATPCDKDVTDDFIEIPDEEEPEETETMPELHVEEKKEYNKVLQGLGYRNYSDVEQERHKEVSYVGNPRIISPENFGELDYKIVELTYWADNVLTDSKNKVVKDVDALIGKGTLDQFGKIYEDDSLHVRDDEKKIDFEILRDLKRYSDFFGNDDPHQAEEE